MTFCKTNIIFYKKQTLKAAVSSGQNLGPHIPGLGFLHDLLKLLNFSISSSAKENKNTHLPPNLWWKSVNELEKVILKIIQALHKIQLSVILSELYFFLKGICTKLDATYA